MATDMNDDLGKWLALPYEFGSTSQYYIAAILGKVCYEQTIIKYTVGHSNTLE